VVPPAPLSVDALRFIHPTPAQRCIVAEFNTYQAFQIFRQHVLHESRYIRDDLTQSFLKTLLATSSQRCREVRKDRIYWRAQEGHGWESTHQDDDDFEVPVPHTQNRMQPSACAATEGRANPKGIPRRGPSKGSNLPLTIAIRQRRWMHFA
jgi:hypothetical protein